MPKCSVSLFSFQVEANKWLDHATMCSDTGTALNCCSAALHFASRDESLQSLIYGCRAMLFHDSGQHKERDKDIEKCKKLDFEVAQVIFNYSLR